MKTKGFTLVELLVVIAILAILATVSVVGYTTYIKNANESLALQEMTQVKSAILAEDIANNDFAISTAGVLTEATGKTGAFKTYIETLDNGLNGTLSHDATAKTVKYTSTKDPKVTATLDLATGTITVNTAE